MEEFKRRLSFDLKVYIEDKSENDLIKVAQLADSYTLLRKTQANASKHMVPESPPLKITNSLSLISLRFLSVTFVNDQDTQSKFVHTLYVMHLVREIKKTKR